LKGETVKHVDVRVENGEDGSWGDWTQLGILEPGEQLGIGLNSENVQIARGWHGDEAACKVPDNGLVGPFDTVTRISARVRQTSFRIEGNVTEA
jgi:hypothetical protein